MHLVKIGSRVIHLDNVNEVDLDAEVVNPDAKGDYRFHRPGDAVRVLYANETNRIFRGADATALREYLAAHATDLTPAPPEVAR
jgi:hypothetical protein